MTANSKIEDHLNVRTPAPGWFRAALAVVPGSYGTDVAGTEIRYLRWDPPRDMAPGPGILLAHGGGAHAHWWSFIAPLLCDLGYTVAALNFSGMGDSGWRDGYEASDRVEEIASVLDVAGLGETRFLVGHSFGGLMSMKFAAERGAKLSGAIFVDAPVRSPEEQRLRPLTPPRAGRKRIYPDFESALARFRLMPVQECENDYIVEHIGRYSIARADDGWTWKFDPSAMGARRFQEPFDQHLASAQCRAGIIYGEWSELVTDQTVAYMTSLLPAGAPVVGIPEARHHVTLDQPLAFIAALDGIVNRWLEDAAD